MTNEWDPWRKIDRQKVKNEVEMFKAEYPQYTDEYVSDYMQLLDDFTPEEKSLFCELLGY